MPYRPFGEDGGAGPYRVGDQWPDPPEDVRREVDGDEKLPLNRFERWVYRWLDRPTLMPLLGRHRRKRS